MKDRGKSVETTKSDYYFYSSSSDLPCKKHPSSSSVGICAFCLKDRLVKLVCSDCGEQRLSSCSCSEISSSYQNSSSVEIGSVGRISFLIENEMGDHKKEEIFSLLKRSSSTSVEVKRKKFGFSRIGKFFRRKRIGGFGNSAKSVDGFDEKSDIWVGVSRSRSLCSFRGMYNDAVEQGLVSDFEKKSGFSEAEARLSGFSEGKRGSVSESDNGLDHNCFKNIKENDINGVDDESGFIDLKLDYLKTDYSAFSKTEDSLSVTKINGAESGKSCLRNAKSLAHELGGSFGSFISDELLNNVGSCKITVKENWVKKSRKNMVWKWILGHNPGRKSASKRDDHGLHCEF
ncbi:hypothetical protein RJ641_012343 [Dillenia turbinata]|uniref:Uncharacterized protein n=1 Tax=Dillenia turbinata TaxID=194707 RepID=A0AAN8V1X1_9MAGN